jgi:hypothetical protein
MLFVKCLVTDETNFGVSLYDFLFSDAIEEGWSVDEAVSELWELCCSCCYEEGCERFVILMKDGSVHEFEAGHIGDEERFKSFVLQHWKEYFEDYERELQAKS